MNSYLALTQKSWQAAQYTTSNLLSSALAPVHLPTQFPELILLSAAHAPSHEALQSLIPRDLPPVLTMNKPVPAVSFEYKKAIGKYKAQFFSLRHLHEYMRMVLVTWQFYKAVQQHPEMSMAEEAVSSSKKSCWQ